MFSEFFLSNFSGTIFHPLTEIDGGILEGDGLHTRFGIGVVRDDGDDAVQRAMEELVSPA